ncbi:hypothetical protein CNR22_10635 [Sphingobacteriaceae bacterium]|nr:hypothetical protein CNR22_10635 [Sphingobacteriaceae bacterium]
MTSFFSFFNKVRAEKFFLFTSLFFGLCFLFITPPFQVPDEPNHFYRTWQIAEGELISVKQDKRVGGNLPTSLEKLVHSYTRMIGVKDFKIKDLEIQKIREIPLEQEQQKFYDFNNTALYSPVCYIPGAIAIFITNLCNANPFYAFYLARLFSLLTWIMLVFCAIKILPFYKWLFSFLALLPMSLFVNMSLSADVITNAVCFLFIATVIGYAYDPFAFNATRRAKLLGVIVLLVSIKLVYAPLLLLLLVIPGDKFTSLKNRVFNLGVLVLAGLVFFVFWNTLLSPLYINYENYNPQFRDGAALVNGADAGKQMHLILHGGWYFYDVVVKSSTFAFDMYFNGYIGTFGWLEFSLPFWLVCCAYCALILLSLADGSSQLHVGLGTKFIFLLSFVIILFLVLLSQHLIWDYVGAEFIVTLQGRYFIPFVPLFFVVFYNRLFSAKKLSMFLSISITLICLIISLQLIWTRYI